MPHRDVVIIFCRHETSEGRHCQQGNGYEDFDIARSRAVRPILDIVL